jgi:hypothetical protein
MREAFAQEWDVAKSCKQLLKDTQCIEPLFMSIEITFISTMNFLIYLALPNGTNRDGNL